MTIKKEIGNYGEEVAARLLGAKGYQIVERNFRCRTGEIDIIARMDNCYHFVEVKTRQSDNFGHPAESVTQQKQNRVIAAARYYLYINGISNVRVQFDVMEIEINFLMNCF